MNDRATIVLVEEWHRQLCDALDAACASFPDPEPQRIRVWRAPVNPLDLMGSMHRAMVAPADDTPADQWEWEVVHRTPPHLIPLEETIARIGNQITRLGENTQ